MSDMQRCIRAEEGRVSIAIPSVAEAAERAIQASPSECGADELPDPVHGGGASTGLDVLPRREDDEDEDWDDDDEDEDDDDEDEDLDEEDQEDWEYDWDEGDEDDEGEDEEGW